MSEGERKIPPFASGRLVGDYSPLFEYWKVAREKGREDLVEKAMLTDDDYKLLASMVGSRDRILVIDLIEILIKKLITRIDGDLAYEALERLGYKMPKAEARRYIARLLASWLIEAGDYWKIVSLS